MTLKTKNLAGKKWKNTHTHTCILEAARVTSFFQITLAKQRVEWTEMPAVRVKKGYQKKKKKNFFVWATCD